MRGGLVPSQTFSDPMRLPADAKMPNRVPSSTPRGRVAARSRVLKGIAMARDFLVFGDIQGKLDVLRVECTRCDRKGRYSVAKLIEKHGRRGNLTRWVSDLKGDCPKREVPALYERCDLICPDLRKMP